MRAVPIVAIVALTVLQVPPILSGVHRIVMMGDSITQIGGGPKGYVTLVTRTLAEDYPQQPIEVLNAGISGNKSDQMLARFQTDVLDKKPDLVTINVGVNDVWHNFRNATWTARVPTGDSGRGVPLDQYIANVDSMISMAKKSDVRVILVSPTLVYEDLGCAENQRLTRYANAEKDLARKDGVPFVDLNRAFRAAVEAYHKTGVSNQLLLTVDGVHMNDAGNALMADDILRGLGAPVPDSVRP